MLLLLCYRDGSLTDLKVEIGMYKSDREDVGGRNFFLSAMLIEAPPLMLGTHDSYDGCHIIERLHAYVDDFSSASLVFFD